MKILMTLALALAIQKAPVRRAMPPATFDKATTSIFMENAFESLEGERPRAPDQETDQAETTQTESEQGNSDFDRGDMMDKLEAAEASIAQALADKKSFTATTYRINGAADIVIMMGKALFCNDPDYGQEDDYLKFAEDMTTAAKQLKVLAQQGDYEGASRALSTIKKNCNACHDQFRL